MILAGEMLCKNPIRQPRYISVETSYSSAAMQRIIIKLGTQVVIEDEDSTPALERLKSIVAECAVLSEQGKDVVVVSSGAVGLGKKQLQLSRTLELREKQACAALGQGKLMSLYSELFAAHSRKVAQILVTAADFSDRERYLNLRSCFEQCFSFGVIPIVNENDVVSTAGIIEVGNARSFDDNDRLSSIVAAKLQADTLLILTNVAGVFTDNPSSNPNAELLRTLEIDNAEVRASGTSSGGRGGMQSKLKAARIAALCGIETIISSGFTANAIQFALSGDAGTLIYPKGKLKSRQAWIGVASGHQGTIVVNRCTSEALNSESKMSLLPVGVVSIVGEFSTKDIVSIQDEAGAELARGIVSMSSSTLNRIKGMHSEAAKPLLLEDEKPEVVHRDNLVLLV